MDEIIKFLKEKNFLAEEADEKLIQEKVSEFVEGKVKETTTGLIKNRDELKEEKLKLQKSVDEIKSQYQFVEENGLSVDVFLDMKNELENYRAKGGTDVEIEKKITESYERGKKQSQDVFTPQITKLQKDLEETMKAKENAIKSYNNYKAESEIRAAVNKTGVKADDIWFKGLMNSAQVDIDEKGKMSISLPYEGGGNLPIEDWVKSFPTTEVARRMMPAVISTGGGGFGGSSSSESDEGSIVDQYNKMFKS